MILKFLSQSSLVGGSKLLEKVLSFGIIILVSRKLGSEAIGQFFYYFSLVSLLIPLMDIGFQKVLFLNWEKRDFKSRRETFTHLVFLKLIAGLLTLIISIGIDQISMGENARVSAVMAAFLAIYFDQFGELLRTPDRAKLNVRYDAAVPLAGRLLSLILILAFLGEMQNGYEVCYLYAFSSFVSFLLSMFAMHSYYPTLLGDIKFGECKRLIRLGVPFSFTGVFVMISLYVDSVILGHFSLQEVGYYNVAYRLVLLSGLLSGGICHVLYPRITKAMAHADFSEVQPLLAWSAYLMVTLFGSIAIGCFFFGEQLILVIYGAEFEKAAALMPIFAPLVLILSMTNLFGQSLEALGKQKMTMYVCMFSSMINLVLNLLLIPVYGMIGAAFTTLLSETTTLILALIILKKYYQFTLPKIIRPIAFLSVILFCYWKIQSLSIWIGIPLGALIYLIIMLPFSNIWLSQVPKVKEIEEI